MAKITWRFVNENGTNLNRYIATNVATGETITFDLLRGGTINVVGTPLNAENLNQLIDSLNAAYDLISSSERNTTYILTRVDDTVTLKGSDGSNNSFNLSDKASAAELNNLKNIVNNKLDKAQGVSNANKFAFTDSNGNITFIEKIPSNALPETGVSVDTAKNVESASGKVISGLEIEKGLEDINQANSDINELKQTVKNELTEITSIVNCDHRYEITGATNDEHNLAIDDQQMLINKISGRTLVRNQLVDLNLMVDKAMNGMKSEKNTSTGIITISGTSTIEGQTWFRVLEEVTLIKNHVYYLSGCPAGGSTVAYGLYLSGIGVNDYPEDFGEGKLFTAKYDAIYDLSFFTAGAITVNYKVRPQLIDLTLAYGIGNEPTKVEEFLNDFPEYIPYDKGTFVHSNNKLISTGKNLWKYGDVSGTQYVEVALDTPIKAGRYTISAFVESTDTDNTISVVNYSDKDSKTFAETIYNRNETLSRTITFIKDVYFVKFYASDTWNNGAGDKVSYKNFQIEYGEVATDYKPYKEEVIQSVGELKQYDYKDNQSGNDVFGSGVIDLGTIDGWTYYEGYDGFYNSTLSSFFNENMVMPLNSNDIPYAITQRYMSVGDFTFSNLDTTADLVFTINVNGMIKIRDKSCNGDANLLKQALQGVKLLYKKTNPTIVENDNLPAGYAVYKGGLQEQQGTIPYNIEKQYALSIASQVAQNIEIDREQQKQINELKNDIENITFDGYSKEESDNKYATKEDIDALTSDEQPLDGLRYEEENPGYVEIRLSEDIRLDLRNINEDYSIDLGGHKCVIINPNDAEIRLIGDFNLSGEITIYNYANIPQICFSSANKGEIWLEALKSNNVNQFLVEFKNNCFILRNVFVGEI